MKNRWKCEKGIQCWKKDIQRASQSSNFGQLNIFWTGEHFESFSIKFLNWILNWIFWPAFEWIVWLNEYFKINFELNIELNHFWARFNVWLNNQNVSNRATHYHTGQHLSFQYLENDEGKASGSASHWVMLQVDVLNFSISTWCRWDWEFFKSNSWQKCSSSRG